MELRIDFYSKQDVSIRMDFAGRYPFPANEASELFLFTCYALRQFSNLGNHPAAMALAVLLITYDKDTAIKLGKGSYEFPGPAQLGFLMGSEGVKIDVDYALLRDHIMPGLPKLVDFQGEGKKAFIVTVPPFCLRPKGFGLLGFQVNYYAFQSVIALFRYLAQKHIDEGVYLDHLSQVARYCGKFYIARGVPLGDQVALANAILKEVGIMS